MALESIARGSTAPFVQPRLRRAVDDLDATIRVLGSTIFALQAPQDASPPLRPQMIDTLADASGESELELDFTSPAPWIR